MAGEVCGAVSGAVLAIGLLYGQEETETVTNLTEQFMRRFAEWNGAVRCIDLVGLDIGSATTDGEISDVKQLLMWLARGGKRACNRVISSAVEVLLEELKERTS